MENAFREFGIEAKITSVAGPQTIGRDRLELPLQVRAIKEVQSGDTP